MLRFAPLAMLAMAPLAQAHFDWLHPRRHVEECCPCPVSGTPEHIVQTMTISEHAETTHTITVTKPASYPSKETVVIEHTITLPGKTVYYTHVEQHTVTEKVLNPVAPSQAYNEEHYDKTTTVIYGLPSQGADEPKYEDEDEVLVKTITIYGDKEEEHYHFTTITEGENYNQVTTVTLHNPGETHKVVQATKTATIQYSDERVLTKTVQDGDKHYTVPFGNSDDCVTKTIYESGKPYTVVIKPKPSAQTFTEEGGKETTRIIEVYQTATITAQAQTQTVTEQEYKTITTTMIDPYGQPDVEIIIYHIETGKSTCEKLSGLPCHDDEDNYGYPQVSDLTATEGSQVTKTDCSISTSIQTVYNTVVKTVRPDGAATPETTGSPSATEGLQQPMSSRIVQVQQPRFPRSLRW
ncbi:hypothetical protein EDB81DRAFT_925172 [Dactylonectria macrodidyma]|uniref:Uncharacterized protein n=1 Tax=Dactylonectria macrodidyma TaxID=307937 RepID=A0A9P9JDM9_9HYPO|nr:hypothetical protein EDB81DRAFT_925172 [Dactylonectria macrodidyma]